MIIVLFGPPGCGKGTQGSVLAKEFGMKRLVVGDLLRKEIASESSLSVQIKEIISSGKLVSDSIVNQMITPYIMDSLNQDIIIDGYPRNISQANFLQNIVEENSIELKVISLEVPNDVLLDRITSRLVCKDCNHSYNLNSKPTKKEGICDNCGSSNLIQRSDDNEVVFKNRIKEYKEQTSSLISFYTEKGCLISIDANQQEQIVTNIIKREIKSC